MRKPMIKTCAICGKKFVAKSGRQEYCSKACQAARHVGEPSAKDLRTKIESEKRAGISYKQISEVAREARERGMSYGRYVALLELRQKAC